MLLSYCSLSNGKLNLSNAIMPFHNEFFGDIINYRVNSLVGIMFGKKYIARLNINMSIKELLLGKESAVMQTQTHLFQFDRDEMFSMQYLCLPATLSAFFNALFRSQFSPLWKAVQNVLSSAAISLACSFCIRF